MSPFFPKLKRFSRQSYSTVTDFELPPKPSPMCRGTYFRYAECGHTQTHWNHICATSGGNKAYTSCDLLEDGGIKDGACAVCQNLDAHIENLREELKLKEEEVKAREEEVKSKKEELNEAILARSGKPLVAPRISINLDPLKSLSPLKPIVLNPNLTVPIIVEPKRMGMSAPTSASKQISQRESAARKENIPLTEHKKAESWASTFASKRIMAATGMKFKEVERTKFKTLAEDLLDISNSWLKEREGYQDTINAFQNKSLGVASFKEKIQKCNEGRDGLIRARFEAAEAEIVKG